MSNVYDLLVMFKLFLVDYSLILTTLAWKLNIIASILHAISIIAATDEIQEFVGGCDAGGGGGRLPVDDVVLVIAGMGNKETCKSQCLLVDNVKACEYYKKSGDCYSTNKTVVGGDGDSGVTCWKFGKDEDSHGNGSGDGAGNSGKNMK